MQKITSSLTDEELVLRANEGDSAAEELIFRRYKACVKGKARTYFLIGADSDDIVQEGMIGLYKAVRDFKAEKNISFKTFADLCVTRQIVTAIRSANRNKHSPLNSYISISATTFDEDGSLNIPNLLKDDKSVSNPEELYITNESFNELKDKIFKKLSNFEKSVLGLYLEGCSYVEISEHIGKPVKSIDNAIQRIRKKLVDFTTDN